MCLRRAVEKDIAGAKAPAGAAGDRAAVSFPLRRVNHFMAVSLFAAAMCTFPLSLLLMRFDCSAASCPSLRTKKMGERGQVPETRPLVSPRNEDLMQGLTGLV
jgi:hypothetical protein